MLRYEVIASTSEEFTGDGWKTLREWNWGWGLFFCQRGARALGLRWSEGARAVVDVSRRPLRDGVSFVVRSYWDAELGGRKLPWSGDAYAVAPKLFAEAEERGLLGKTLYVRAKLLLSAKAAGAPASGEA